MADFTIRRGYNIRISGEADGALSTPPRNETVALKPTDFRGVTPRLVAKEGDRVLTGAPLFHDRNNPSLLFTSPASGKITGIVRGERRAIEAVVIQTDGKNTAHSHGITRRELASGDRDVIIKALLATGLFPYLRQRPFSRVAGPGDIPRDIFVSALNTAPLSPDPNLIVRGNEEYFTRGLETLSKLTAGRVHLSVEKNRGDLSPAFSDAAGVAIHRFNRLHPAGAVGVQIHHIAPVRGRNDIVWHCPVHGVINIGRFFATGVLSFETTVAVTGDAAPRRNCCRVTTGAPVRDLVGPVPDPGSKRFISGDPLSGKEAGYDGYTGFYDNQITVLEEAAGAAFLGWLSPGLSMESVSVTFLSRLLPRKRFPLTTNRNGSMRAFVATGVYEKVLPMDIYPMFLLKSILAEDIEEMENLGIYEVAEEDFALCEFVCPSKTGIQDIIRRGIELMEKEA